MGISHVVNEAIPLSASTNVSCSTVFGRHTNFLVLTRYLSFHRLRQSWYESLDNAQTNFRQHLTSHSSNDWRRVNVEGSPSSAKGKAKASSEPHLTDVVLHRKVSKGESIYRAVLDVPTSDEPQLTLEACKAVLATPELRKEWDPSVEKAQLLEMFDQATRIAKTDFTLGWPARCAA